MKGHSEERKRWLPSLGVALLGVVVAAIVVPVAVSITLSTSNANALFRGLAARNVFQSASGLARLLDMRLESSERTARVVVALFEHNVVALNGSAEAAALASMLGTLSASDFTVSALSLTTPQGLLYGALKTPENYTALWVSDAARNLTCELEVVDPLTYATAPWEEATWCITNYQGERAIWYTSVNASVSGDESWTEAYITHMVYYSYSIACPHCPGVVVADLLLDELRRYVLGWRLLSDDTTGAVLVVDLLSPAPTLIASTNLGINAMLASRVLELPPEIATFNHTITRLLTDVVMAEVGSWRAALEQQMLWLDGHTLASFSLVRRENIEWLIVYIREPQLATVGTSVIVTTLLVALFFLVFTVVFGASITTPLRAISNDMVAVSHLDFDSRGNGSKRGFTKKCACMPTSWLRELHDMQNSWTRLRAGTRALTRYVAPVVARRSMLNESGDVQTGMEMAQVTILFVDMQRFSGLSERLPHEMLMSIARSYFSELGEAIERNGGTIDKFVGDAVMALFGAPEPIHNAEVAACKTAADFEEAMIRVNAHARSIGCDEKISHRVGIHSGRVLIGNLGSQSRVNFSVCGTTANIAARLEQLGKEYHISPLVSGHVEIAVREEFVCVLLDIVKLRGHTSTHTQVFHLVCRKDEPKAKSPGVLAAIKAYASIHRKLAEGNVAAALGRIEEALSDEFIATAYGMALAKLRANIQNGLTTSESYHADTDSPMYRCAHTPEHFDGFDLLCVTTVEPTPQ